MEDDLNKNKNKKWNTTSKKMEDEPSTKINLIGCDTIVNSHSLRIITSGVDISTRVFLTYSSPSSPVYSCLLMVALAAHPWEFLEAQVYHQVLRSLEELFLVNLKHSWVIKTPSFELFPEFYK